MRDDEVVKEIEEDKEHSLGLRMARSEISLAIQAIDKFRETSYRYASMDYGLPDSWLDFWTMADIRAERMQSNLKLLWKQLTGEESNE